ncbi:MAG: YbjN domain-containing protein [Cyanobacteria bacterium P01_H01_bin.130]
MQYKSDSQKECFEKILPWLKGLPNQVIWDREAENPTVYITEGSACVLVEVLPWEDNAAIDTRSYVVTHINLQASLLEFLLRENDRLLFGAFGIDSDGDIFLGHTIVGSECDKDELETSVRSILALADDYDDVIVDRWGGQRAVDRTPNRSEASSAN